VLYLNVHTHALVLDGVFAEDGSGGLRFHPVAPPSDTEMDDLLGIVERRLRRLLARRGTMDDAEGESAPDPWVAEAPVLAGIAAASSKGASRLGRAPGPRFAAVARHRSCRRCRYPHSARVTRIGTGSISMPALSCRPMIGRGSKGRTGMHSDHPWPTIGFA
jgi:rubredoxin